MIIDVSPVTSPPATPIDPLIEGWKLGLVPSGPSGEAATIEIYNSIGAKLMNTKFTGETKLNIDFPAGIYFAKINSGNKTIVKKFLVE